MMLAGCGAPSPSARHAGAVSKGKADGWWVALEGEPCAGADGTSCDDGLFCDASDSLTCPDQNTPGVCAVRPQICTEVYRPACGCDGKTYGNGCTANGNGVAVLQDGPCASAGQSCTSNADCAVTDYCQVPDETCGGVGTCVSKQQPCDDATLVCGCDGTNYARRCFAAGTGTNVAHTGACIPAPPPVTPQACSADADCTGNLPNVCQQCSDGTSQCAHWVCAGGQCNVHVCPIVPLNPPPPPPPSTCASDGDCASGQLCCYPCGIPGCQNSCMAPAANGRCPLFP